MGLGGDLMWTAVLGAIGDIDGRQPVACLLPGASDLLAGRPYDGAVSLRDTEPFRNNPDIEFTDAGPKGMGARWVDALGGAFLRIPAARRWFEERMFRRAERLRADGGPHYVHIDARRHSYASHQTRRRTFWKPGRALDAMAAPFGVARVDRPPSLHFSPEEEAATARLLAASGLDGPFVAVEPDSNRDWFGDLRAWPMERWQAAVERLRAARPDVPVVQIGLGRSGVLPGAVDLTGKTDFRGATLVLRASSLFIGTEGGLMHAARAVEARALILWGGITLPEFIGYPDHQTTLCRHVPCAPCGNAGWCEYGHRCMAEITVDDVAETALGLLARTAAGGTA